MSCALSKVVEHGLMLISTYTGSGTFFPTLFWDIISLLFIGGRDLKGTKEKPKNVCLPVRRVKSVANSALLASHRAPKFRSDFR